MYKIYILFICLSIVSKLNSQSVNGRFIEVLNSGTEFKVKVQLNANSPGLHLGTSTLIFDYNSSGLSFPNLPVDNIDYQFHNYTSTTNIVYDSATVTLVGTNRIYINIDLLSSNSGELIAEDPNWSDIVTLTFSTIDSNQPSGIIWVYPNNPPPSSEIFAGDNLTLLTPLSFEGLNSILPVELISFSATTDENIISLSWETATEINNFGFEVERTTNLANKVWNTIGFVQGAGNSNSNKIYSFIDNSPIGTGKIFYRLKQIDSDGSIVYSDQVEVEFTPKEYYLFQNFPNPFNPTTTIRFSVIESQNVSICIYDQIGQQVDILVDQKFESGYHEIEFNSSHLTSGIYFYRIIAGDFVNVKKMVIIK